MGKMVDLKSVIDLIKVEPEIPGPMPDEIWKEIQNNKKKAANLYKALVRSTKRNIINRITSIYGDGE